MRRLILACLILATVAPDAGACCLRLRLFHRRRHCRPAAVHCAPPACPLPTPQAATAVQAWPAPELYIHAPAPCPPGAACPVR